MRVIHDLGAAQPERDVLLTIGTFDGVHRGHQYLLRRLVRSARQLGCLSGALTFHPHPRTLLQPEFAPAYLTSPEERAELLAGLGIDLLVLLPFTSETAAMPAVAFMETLQQSLRLRQLWVGEGFALGREREGDIPALRALGRRLGYHLEMMAPLCQGNAPISSTRIRSLIQSGRVSEAAELLGRPYGISGTVVPGARRGRTLGFRTANLRPEPERALPANGVYAVWAVVGDARYAGAANVGVRPSFGDDERVLEVHLLDFEGDLYAQVLRIEFAHWLRPELRFERVEDLVARMHEDAAATRALLGQQPVRS